MLQKLFPKYVRRDLGQGRTIFYHPWKPLVRLGAFLHPLLQTYDKDKLDTVKTFKS